MKTKDDIFEKLKTLENELKPFGIARIGVFGSYACGKPRPDSDIDLLIEFDETPGLLQLAELHLLLEHALTCRVDLATKEMLAPSLKDQVLDEVVYHD